MSELGIYRSSRERLESLSTPTELQRINVIPTPYSLKGEFILLGKLSKGHLVALFPDPHEEYRLPDSGLKLSNGFELLHHELRMTETGQTSCYLELRNVGNIDLNLFGALIDEVLRTLDRQIVGPVEVIKTVLERWKHILSLDSDRVMSANKLIGLLGELLLLEHLIQQKTPNILNNWVGPLGSRHDFEFANSSIEVKSTTTRIGNEITVHGITQLESSVGKDINILKIKFEPAPTGLSVPEVVNRILETDGVSANAFYEKLTKVGYSHLMAEAYFNFRLQPIEFQLIPVDEKFPRITKEALKEFDKDGRILDIEYVVNVSGLENQKSTSLSGIRFGDLL